MHLYSAIEAIGGAEGAADSNTPPDKLIVYPVIGVPVACRRGQGAAKALSRLPYCMKPQQAISFAFRDHGALRAGVDVSQEQMSLRSRYLLGDCFLVNPSIDIAK